MANSYVEYTIASNGTGTGTNAFGQTTFTAPTKFLSINDIRIKGLNGSTWTELTISTRGTTTVTLSAAPTAYSTIRVFRSSTTEALIDFQNGSRLSESDLDTAYQQSLFVAQEVAEVADPDGGSGVGNIVNSQLAGGITNDKLAGGITQDKLAGGITSAQLAGSIADSKLASGVGTSANNLVKLDGTAKLPAVDGSQLTNVVGGKILQAVVNTTETNSAPSSTSAWTGTGLSASITPSSTSSRILLMVNANGYQPTSGQYYMLNVHRHTSSIGDDGSTSSATRLFNDGKGFGIIYGNSGDRFGVVSTSFIDSPNTTSEIYYNCTHKKGGGSPEFNGGNPTSSIVLLEIAS